MKRSQTTRPRRVGRQGCRGRRRRASSGVVPGSGATSDQVEGKESVSEQDNEDEGVTLHSQASLAGGVLGNEQFTADVNETESIAEQDKGDIGDTTTGPTWTTSRTCISPTTSRPATR